MTRISIRPKKLADIEAALPGFKRVWERIKERTESDRRWPSGITFCDESTQVHMNDNESGHRFALDLRTMQLGADDYPLSGGEWAVQNTPQHDGAVAGIPDGMAVVDCVWNKYYKYFSITITVRPGAIPAQLTRAA